MKHIIELPSGKIELEQHGDHVYINTPDRLSCLWITASINTVWSDTDLAVSVNGKWLDGAFSAGQHKDTPLKERGKA